MDIRKQKLISQANILRYDASGSGGHYESYFLRANHPTKKEAFWIRYTIFSPNGRPSDAIGELWAIHFSPDGNTADKLEFPIKDCSLHPTHFHIQIGKNSLNSIEASGKMKDIAWSLQYKSDQEPLFLLPLNMYSLPFPKAKALVPAPMAVFNGTMTVKDKVIQIKDWVGSQNHNWGEKHTDHYAWGQVAGFDNFPQSFLELTTARVKVGPFTTPFLTVIVLRHEGKEYRINSMKHAIRSKGSFDYFFWDFDCENEFVRISGRITSEKEDFIGLNYYNPIGGSKDCLNSKVASCRLTVEEKSQIGIKDDLYTAHRAAFEILTDDHSHGIPVHFK
jgi:hypothetical protein